MLKGPKQGRIQWSDSSVEAFLKLKQSMVERPVLIAPDFLKTFIVVTDASLRAVSGVLLQENEGLLCPIAYQSRKLTEAESRYPVIEREGLAIIYACSVYKPYLLGRRFMIITDHKPLQYIRKTMMQNSRIHRWFLVLEEFSFDVSYQSGKKNVLADFLSRPPVDTLKDYNIAPEFSSKDPKGSTNPLGINKE